MSMGYSDRGIRSARDTKQPHVINCLSDVQQVWDQSPSVLDFFFSKKYFWHQYIR